MTRFSHTASRRPLQIAALCLIYIFMISLCITPNQRSVHAATRIEAETRANSSNLDSHLLLSPQPSPTPAPSPTSSPETAASPVPEPTMTPTTVPSPTQGVPDISLPNLDGLRNVQPEVPEAPEEVPSTRCSPGQPDCDPATGQPLPPDAFYRERGCPRPLTLSDSAARYNLTLDHLLAWNVDPFSTPFFKMDSSREATDTSVSTNSFFPLLEPVSGGTYDDFVMARLDPDNRIGNGGEDLLSRNFNWSLPLVGMAGRAGLNLGLSLSYNSLVWTRAGGYITFDADNGFPTPGFHLGFPVVYGQHYNSQTGKNGYLMLMPSGARVELRQVGSTNTYEAADSSYLQLIDNLDGSLLVRSTDGTRLSYYSTQNGFRCSEVKDRNGNYVSVTYSEEGRLESITDTLGRLFNFNLDENKNLGSISQTRGSGEYTLTQEEAVLVVIPTRVISLLVLRVQMTSVNVQRTAYWTIAGDGFGVKGLPGCLAEWGMERAFVFVGAERSGTYLPAFCNSVMGRGYGCRKEHQ